MIIQSVILSLLIAFTFGQTCSRTHTVQPGETCYSIWTKYALSDAAFFSLNPTLNCNLLQPGQTVCVAAGTYTTQAPTYCPGYWYSIKSGDTCTSIIYYYNAQNAQSFYTNNPTINCNALQVGSNVCVTSTTQTTTTTTQAPPVCQSYYQVKYGDTCSSIISTFGQATPNFYYNNPTLNCNALQIGQIVCLTNVVITTTTTTTPVPVPQCQSYYIVKSGDTCGSIMAAFGQTSTNFYYNNPSINCNALIPGQQICLTNIIITTTTTTTTKPVPICHSYYNVQPGDSCASIINQFGQVTNTFYANNPTLNCNALVPGQSVCLYNVIYTTTVPTTTTTTRFTPVCDQYHTVQSGDTCGSIISYYGQVPNTFYANNPTINCNSALTPGQIICLTSVVITTTQPPFQPACQSWYTVKSGDTCSYIINYYGQSSTQFTQNNPNINCNNLQAGQSICLGYPVQDSIYEQKCQSYHTVKNGDSCQSIQDAFNQDKNTFAVLNPTINCNNLAVGTTICLGYPADYEYDTQYCRDYYWSRYGETCASIASSYGMTYNAFVTANPWLDCTNNNNNILPNNTRVCLGYNIASHVDSVHDCGTTYTVQNGDTCQSIFSRYTQSYTEFLTINPNLNCNGLYAGQVICLGAAQTRTVYQQTCESWYTVQQYDTCASIIQKFGEKPTTFYAANANVNCNNLQVGQRICIGFGTQKVVHEESCKQYHSVNVGDTCSSIVAYYNEDWNTFNNANNHLDCSNLIVGERVCIGYQQTTTIYEQNCESYYTVKDGDTCVGIISTHSQDANHFFRSNPSIDCSSLRVGQIICLGYTGVDSVNLRTCQHYHTVQSGESCQTLLNRYNQDQKTFYDNNRNVDCSKLYEGQIVCMSYDQDLTVYQKVCQTNHIVKAGETCASIIKMYNVQNENDFDASNPGLDCTNLQVGQAICISSTTQTTRYEEQCTRYHNIDADDTCSSLIWEFKQNRDLFYESNPNIDCNSLRIGQVVCLDYSTETSVDKQVCQSKYTIKSGDSCASIISLYGLDSTRFYQANQYLDCNNLAAGQDICLDYRTEETTYKTGCESYHTVAAGDTCSSIINYYNQDQNTFFTSNPTINCNNLEVGRKVCLGYSVTTHVTRENCQQYYTIKSGDTCSEIVQYYMQRGYNTDTFYAANPSIDCGDLYAGQVVCLGYQTSTTYYDQSCHSYYTVKSDDSCQSIINYFGQAPTTFYAQNPSINCANLVPGEVLCLDTSIVDSNLQKHCSSYYTVKVGDSCSSVISTYNLNSNIFYNSNPNINCANLQPGQVLCLGSTETLSSYERYCPSYYTVKSGDTCDSIITYTSQNWYTFHASNPDLNCSNLHDGQVLCMGTVV